MTNEEIRRSNLAILYKESGCRFDNDFCRSIDMMPAQYSQVKFGPKRIGDKMARKIEQGAKKPIGWMDAIHSFEIQTSRSQAPVQAPAHIARAVDDDIIRMMLVLKQLPVAVQSNIRRLIFSLAAEFPATDNTPAHYDGFQRNFPNEQRNTDTQDQTGNPEFKDWNAGRK